MTNEQKADLRRLSEAATPGPWGYCGCGKCGAIGSHNEHENGDFLIADTDAPWAQYVTGPKPRERVDADGRYIVAACNAIPELLDELGSLRELALELAAEVLEWDGYCREFDYLEECRPTTLLDRARAAGLIA